MLERKIVREISDWIDKSSNEALLVEGAKRVGKTYIIEHVIAKKFKSHVTIDFIGNPKSQGIFSKSLDPDTIIRNICIQYPSFRLVPGKTAIFLDEIQGCPNARTALKYLAQDDRIKVIASCSLPSVNCRKVRSYPVGYEKRIELRSLDFEEFLWARKMDRKIIDEVRLKIKNKERIDDFILSRFDELYHEYMAVGGMPEAVSAYISDRSIDSVREAQAKIVDGYRNDIAKYSPPLFRDRTFACFDSVPRQLSRDDRKFMYSEIADDAAAKNSQRYSSGIQWLLDAGIVTRCCNVSEPKEPLAERVKSNMFKLYMSDTGLLAYILGRETQVAILKGDHRVNRGAVQENITAESLSKCGIPLRYFSTASLEIDFIASFSLSIAAMEVKSGNNRRSQSLRSMKDKYGVKRRMKFEVGNISVDAEGVEHYPLFASAFADSLYEKSTFVPDDDMDGFNSKALEIIDKEKSASNLEK